MASDGLFDGLSECVLHQVPLVKALAGDEAEATQLWNRVVPPSDVESNLKMTRLARGKFKAASQ